MCQGLVSRPRRLEEAGAVGKGKGAGDADGVPSHLEGTTKLGDMSSVIAND